MRADIQKNVRFNFIAGVTDGGFFGFGMGFASYVVVIPLFVSTLTDSSVLIGLIAAMHMIGWQLPQLLTANRVARLRRYKPMVLLMTLNERVPFFILAIIAFSLPHLDRQLALALTFIFVTWQAMGGGLTGTAWQSMIAKIMPSERRGTFYGVQSAAANLMMSGSAVLAGVLLAAVPSPYNFALCFALAGLCMIVSFGALASTREPESPAVNETRRSTREFWHDLRGIVSRDGNFRLFIGARALAQIASLGSAFFTIYAVRSFAMTTETAGVMAGILALAQTAANPIFGWLGDRYSHRLIFAFGVLTLTVSATVALLAPSVEWFYLVFGLAGFGGAALWVTVMALTAEFGTLQERPAYIGLTNTLIAPVTLAAPLVGGWLADAVSYQAMFGLTAVCGLIAAALVIFVMREPRTQYAEPVLAVASPYME